MEHVELSRKIVQARSALILDEPFFGSLALRPDYKVDTTCPTIWVDGVTVGFNPDFVESLPVDELKVVLAHEMLHLVFGHHLRRNGRDSELWNHAGDYAVNLILHNSGKAIPADGLLDMRFADMTADKIYSILENEKQDQQGQDQKDQETPKNDPQGPNGDEQGQGQGQDEQGQQKPNSSGEVRDYPGEDGDGQPTQSDVAQQEQDWQIAATQAATQAEACGNMPGAMMEEIRIMKQPKVDWRGALQRFVDEVAFDDWSYAKPNRRYADDDIIMPTLHNRTLPPIVVAIDTSCSVSSEDLQQFAGEIEQILTAHDTEIRVVYCDTSVKGGQIFTREDMPIQLDAKGRGGTAFSPAFKHINQMDEQPVCCVYLTDLDCDDFGPEPDYPVLWVQTEGRLIRETPFGEVIKMY